VAETNTEVAHASRVLATAPSPLRTFRVRLRPMALSDVVRYPSYELWKGVSDHIGNLDEVIALL
jgi:hypothetical protein